MHAMKVRCPYSHCHSEQAASAAGEAAERGGDGDKDSNRAVLRKAIWTVATPRNFDVPEEGVIQPFGAVTSVSSPRKG